MGSAKKAEVQIGEGSFGLVGILSFSRYNTSYEYNHFNKKA